MALGFAEIAGELVKELSLSGGGESVGEDVLRWGGGGLDELVFEFTGT